MQDITLGHHDEGTTAFMQYYISDPLRASELGVHSTLPLLPVMKETIEQEIQSLKNTLSVLDHSLVKKAHHKKNN